jgi:dienelactone hydrolase
MNQNQKCGILPNSPLRKLFSFFLFLSSFFLFSIQSSFAQYQKTQRAVTTNVSPRIQGYYESLPVTYASNPTKKFPLLIFMHGVGELGNGSTELPLVLKNAIPKMLNQGIFPASFTVDGQTHSFIVISPQFTGSASYQSEIANLIKYCKQKYRVDEQRIYLTGLSLGGLMTWGFSSETKANADILAAIVPVCSGSTNSPARVSVVSSSKLPMWFLNNSGDPYISATVQQTLVNAINAVIGSPKALLTIHQASGHDAWTKSYDPNFRQNGMNVYEWMLSHKRGATSTPVPEPAAPIANAGSSQVITLPVSSVTLDGSKSTASGGSIVSYTWSKISGSSATITSPTAVKTTVTGLVAGTYQFNLTIKDSNGKVSSSAVSVIVNAASTTTVRADAGINQTIVLPYTTGITANGSGSVVPSGTTILWSKVDGPSGPRITSPSSLKTTIPGITTAGVYVFQLKLTDTKGNVSASTFTVTAKAGAAQSTTIRANAGDDQTITLPYTTGITADGSGSIISAGTTILWSKVSGPAVGKISSPSSLKTTIPGLTTAGVYVFQLKLTDSNGNVSTSNLTITAKSAILAVAGDDQTLTIPYTTGITADGSRSVVPAGTTVLWSKVDGPSGPRITSPSSLKTTIPGITVPGVYVFELKLTDKQGGFSTSTLTVNAKAALRANAGSDQTITVPYTTGITADGSGSVVPPGTTILWTKVDGPSGPRITSPSSLKTTIPGITTPGVYYFQLRLTGSEGNVSTSTLKITAKSSTSQASARTSATSDTTEAIRVSAKKSVDAPYITSSDELNLKINPNPVRSDMSIWISGKVTGKGSLVIYNVQGQILLQQAFSKDFSASVSRTIDVSKLPAGIYVIQIIIDNKYKQVARIMKQ